MAGISNPSKNLTFNTGGRQYATTIKEQIALKSVYADPFGTGTGSTATVTNLKPKLGPLNRDAVYNDVNGWVKWANNNNGIEIHFTYNQATGEIVDIKIIN